MSWNDPSGSGFHSQGEKDSNRQLRNQIDSLAKNYNGGNAWGDAGNYASGRSSGKYSDKLMNNDHLNHMISYLSGRQKQAPAPTPTPPKPTPPPPVVVSPEIKQAVERADAYKSDLIEGNPTEEIYNSKSSQSTVENQDYSKNTYINRNSNSNTKYDFSAKTFAGDVNNKKSASQDFFNKKKDQLSGFPKYTKFMQ